MCVRQQSILSLTRQTQVIRKSSEKLAVELAAGVVGLVISKLLVLIHQETKPDVEICPTEIYNLPPASQSVVIQPLGLR